MASKHGKKSGIFVKHEVLETNCILNWSKSIFTWCSTKIYGITDKIKVLFSITIGNNGINCFFFCRGRWKMQQILLSGVSLPQCIFLNKIKDIEKKKLSKAALCYTMEESRVEILQGFFSCLLLVCTGRGKGFLGWLVGIWKVPFFFYLFHCAKDVSIILLEAPYTSQATQSAWELISVKNSKICKSKR